MKWESGPVEVRTLDREATAAKLNCDKDYVSELFNTGVLPGAKIGRKMVFNEDDVDTYLLKQIAEQTELRRQAAAPKTPRPRGRPRKPRPNLEAIAAFLRLPKLNGQT